MTKIRVLFLLSISFFTSLNAIANSSPEVDSVRLEINTLIKEYNNKEVKLNDKINTAIELTFYYSGYYPGVRVKKMDSAFYYSEVAYDLSKMSKDSNLIYSAGTIYAEYQSGVGNFSKAISILLATRDKLNADNYTARIYNSIIDTYREAGDFKNALNYAKIELEYNLKKSKSKVAKIAFYSTIGDSYSNLNMLDSALYYYNRDYENLMLIDQKTLDKFESMGYFGAIWVVIGNMGLRYVVCLN